MKLFQNIVDHQIETEGDDFTCEYGFGALEEQLSRQSEVTDAWVIGAKFS